MNKIRQDNLEETGYSKNGATPLDCVLYIN